MGVWIAQGAIAAPLHREMRRALGKIVREYGWFFITSGVEGTTHMAASLHYDGKAIDGRPGRFGYDGTEWWGDLAKSVPQSEGGLVLPNSTRATRGLAKLCADLRTLLGPDFDVVDYPPTLSMNAFIHIEYDPKEQKHVETSKP